jgi:hypothetical protein
MRSYLLQMPIEDGWVFGATSILQTYRGHSVIFHKACAAGEN